MKGLKIEEFQTNLGVLHLLDVCICKTFLNCNQKWLIFQIIFRWWKIVPPTRADSKTYPVEIIDSYDDFLHDDRLHSEYLFLIFIINIECDVFN